MRDRIERVVLLPFSMGCISESSIAVGGQFANAPKNSEKSIHIRTKEDRHENAEEYADEEEILSEENIKSPLSLLSVPKFQRLLKNFKNLSQLFAYKDDEMEEEDFSMEIGLPTDVKHVTHIGIDGSATPILSKGWDNLKAPDISAPPPYHSRPSLDLLATPTKVPLDSRARTPVHSTPSSPGMPAEVPPDWPGPHLPLTPPPLAMPTQVCSPVYPTRSPFAKPTQVPSLVRLTPSLFAMPAESSTQCQGCLNCNSKT